MPKLIQVIESEEMVGDGTEEHPHVMIRRYYTPDGALLASSPIPTLQELAKPLTAS